MIDFFSWKDLNWLIMVIKRLLGHPFLSLVNVHFPKGVHLKHIQSKINVKDKRISDKKLRGKGSNIQSKKFVTVKHNIQCNRDQAWSITSYPISLVYDLYINRKDTITAQGENDSVNQSNWAGFSCSTRELEFGKVNMILSQALLSSAMLLGFIC